MDYRKLGRTGLTVSSLCLGTMQWGWTADQETAFAIMDAFVDKGGNFLDTADYYSRWLPGHPGGESEEIIGRWMKKQQNRSSIILTTKVRHPMGPGPNNQGLSRKHILVADTRSSATHRKRSRKYAISRISCVASCATGHHSADHRCQLRRAVAAKSCRS
jgi:aryl-alcohol dehydrogenase-like predicted oxidoreductase